MHTLAVTNSSLIGFEIYSAKGKPCLALETSPIPGANKSQVIEENLTTNSLLKQHNP